MTRSPWPCSSRLPATAGRLYHVGWQPQGRRPWGWLVLRAFGARRTFLCRGHPARDARAGRPRHSSRLPATAGRLRHVGWQPQGRRPWGWLALRAFGARRTFLCRHPARDARAGRPRHEDHRQAALDNATRDCCAQVAALLKGQQKLPDVHIAQRVDIFPDLPDHPLVAGDLGQVLDALFPREADARLHARRRAARHALDLPA